MKKKKNNRNKVYSTFFFKLKHQTSFKFKKKKQHPYYKDNYIIIYKYMLYKDLNKNHRNPFYLKHQQKKKNKKNYKHLSLL